MSFSLKPVWQLLSLTVSRSGFATAVSADKKSSRGADSANLLITVTELASVLVGLNTSKNAVPSRLMEKYQMKTSDWWPA